MASYTLQGFTNDASSPDLDATNLNEMDNAIKVGHDFADSSSATPEAGKAMAWPANAGGTFAPTISFGGASVGVTYLYNNGVYLRIGNCVFFTIDIAMSSKGTSVGDVLISGLPINSGSVQSATSVHLISVTYTGIVETIVASGTKTIVLFSLLENGTRPALTNVNFTNNSYVRVSGFYFV